VADTTDRTGTKTAGALLGVLGGGAVIVGSTLTWAKIVIGASGQSQTQSVLGLQVGGGVTLALGVALASVGALLWSGLPARHAGALLGVVAIGAAYPAAWLAITRADFFAGLTAQTQGVRVEVTLGWGALLVLAGGVVGIVGAVAALVASTPPYEADEESLEQDAVEQEETAQPGDLPGSPPSLEP
jgi:hypothetical protein